jgi:Calcineurin-like phosphoesterase
MYQDNMLSCNSRKGRIHSGVMTRVLAISDEVDPYINEGGVHEIRPQLVISCGDLPFDYLEYVVTLANVPLLYVPGNHDPDLRGRPRQGDLLSLFMPGPQAAGSDGAQRPEGCTNVDGRITDAAGLRVCGLGGSIRYSGGPNQYSEAEMRRRVRLMAAKVKVRNPIRPRPVDLFIAHAPARGVGDQNDPAHRGFVAFHRLVGKLKPKVMLHGHVHPYGRALPDHLLAGTRVINAVGSRILEM